MYRSCLVRIGPRLSNRVLCPFNVTTYGAASSSALLITGPRLTGACQLKSSLTFVRVDTHMSFRPNPPGRSDVKYSCNPSGENAGCVSFAVVLMGAPRFLGASHAALRLARLETQRSLAPTPPARPDK